MPHMNTLRGDTFRVDHIDTGYKGVISESVLRVDGDTGVVSIKALGVDPAVAGKNVLSGAAVYQLFAAGRNGAGSITLTGAKVGDKVAGPGAAYNTTTPGMAAAATFESTITVADQIQQVSASNLSASSFLFTLIHQTPALS
jgi:hypothetical protein